MERSSTSSRSTRAAAPKRKRGALQDISNKAKKSGTRRDASAKPKPRTRAQSSMAPTAASKAKKRSALGEKREPRVKRRRMEGAENQPPAHAKVQTSMLSFQKPKPKVEKVEKEKVQVKQEEPQEPQEPQEPVVQVKQESAQQDNQQEKQAVQLKQEDNQQEEAPTEVPAAPPAQTQHVEYAPRPYSFTFDHKGSCFDEKTYAAGVQDIDAPCATMSSHTAKLVRELDVYYRKHETKYLPEADYIGTVQLDINEKMRTILVDWLVEVGEEYELDSQTFHKAVNLVDRCLKKIKINRKQFQLLGCACMMIAAKFEEVYGPNVEEFVYISDQTYTAEEMLDMEAKVLNALEYRVASTTCYGFVHRYIKAGCTTDKQRSLVKYLCDFALLFYHMVSFKPSKLVASAVYLARLMTDESEPWTPTLHHVTKYNPLELQDCVEELHRLHAIEFQVVSTQPDKAKAVSEKYMADKFQAASKTPSCDDAKLADSFAPYMPS